MQLSSWIKSTIPIVGGVASLLAANGLQASILVAGTGINTTAGFYVENTSGQVFSYEQLFTITSAAQVTSLKINAGSLSTSQTLQAQLFSGNGLQGTGTLLQTFNITVPAGWDGYNTDMPTITTPTSFLLGSGDYSLWLTLALPLNSPNLIYEGGATTANTPDGTLGGTNWSTGITSSSNIVFELDGTVNPAPEPSTAAIVLLGLVGLIGGKRFRKYRQTEHS